MIQNPLSLEESPDDAFNNTMSGDDIDTVAISNHLEENGVRHDLEPMSVGTPFDSPNPTRSSKSTTKKDNRTPESITKKTPSRSSSANRARPTNKREAEIAK
jgi:hypothetical protein